MHNNIMAAGSRDRLPMLATGRYPQWQSWFLRYIDTRLNGDALRKCILRGPYKPITVIVQAVAATDDSLAIPEHTTVETPMNMSPANKALQAVAATDDSLAIPEHTTVETPMNMSPANKARFESEKEAIHLILTGIGDEICSIVDACQTAQEMWEAIEMLQQAFEEDNDPKQAQRDKDMQKNLDLIAKYFKKSYKPTNNNLRTSLNLRNKNMDTTPCSVVPQSGIQCFKCKEFGPFAKECRKPKGLKTLRIISCLVALQNKETEFEKYKAFNDRTVDYDKLEQIVDNAWIKHSKDQFHAPTAQDMEILIQTCLMPLTLKTQNDSFIFVHELKQEMHADLKYAESLEKEIDELEFDKAEFSNMYDMILQECVSNDVMCSYFLSFSDLDALAELQCLYLHKVKECDCLAQKLLKQTKSVSNEVHAEL
nr:hypothetical protein [Tanacetum cinerariifolium]